MGSISVFFGKQKQPKLSKLGCYFCCCTCPSTDSKCIYDSNTNSLRLAFLSQAGFILWSEHNAFMAETERFLMSVILYWDPKSTLGRGLHRSMALILCQNATVLTKVNEQWKYQKILPCMLTIEFDILSQVNTSKDKLYCNYMSSCNFYKRHRIVVSTNLKCPTALSREHEIFQPNTMNLKKLFVCFSYQ